MAKTVSQMVLAAIEGSVIIAFMLFVAAALFFCLLTLVIMIFAGSAWALAFATVVLNNLWLIFLVVYAVGFLAELSVQLKLFLEGRK